MAIEEIEENGNKEMILWYSNGKPPYHSGTVWGKSQHTLPESGETKNVASLINGNYMGLLSHVQMLRFWILIIIIVVSESRLDDKIDDVDW